LIFEMDNKKESHSEFRNKKKSGKSF